jgi:hypothetical protein
MGRIPEFQRQRLSSSVVGTPGADFTVANVASQVAGQRSAQGEIITQAGNRAGAAIRRVGGAKSRASRSLGGLANSVARAVGDRVAERDRDTQGRSQQLFLMNQEKQKHLNTIETEVQFDRFAQEAFKIQSDVESAGEGTYQDSTIAQDDLRDKLSALSDSQLEGISDSSVRHGAATRFQKHITSSIKRYRAFDAKQKTITGINSINQVVSSKIVRAGEASTLKDLNDIRQEVSDMTGSLSAVTKEPFTMVKEINQDLINSYIRGKLDSGGLADAELALSTLGEELKLTDVERWQGRFKKHFANIETKARNRALTTAGFLYPQLDNMTLADVNSHINSMEDVLGNASFFDKTDPLTGELTEDREFDIGAFQKNIEVLKKYQEARLIKAHQGNDIVTNEAALVGIQARMSRVLKGASRGFGGAKTIKRNKISEAIILQAELTQLELDGQLTKADADRIRNTLTLPILRGVSNTKKGDFISDPPFWADNVALHLSDHMQAVESKMDEIGATLGGPQLAGLKYKAYRKYLQAVELRGYTDAKAKGQVADRANRDFSIIASDVIQEMTLEFLQLNPNNIPESGTRIQNKFGQEIIVYRDRIEQAR